MANQLYHKLALEIAIERKVVRLQEEDILFARERLAKLFGQQF